jgi:hypothetical protein
MNEQNYLTMPPATQFGEFAPRYPNLWIYVSTSLVKSYGSARKLVLEELEACTYMSNDFGYYHSNEGCDGYARRRGLQPVRLEDDSRSHEHCLHLRFYYEHLKAFQPVSAGESDYFQYAASIHYEVDRPDHLHPYVDECPICGMTGEYAQYMGASIKDKNERVHDPLGVEIAVFGTIRGEKIVAFPAIVSLEEKYHMRIEMVKPERDDMTTAVIARVFLDGLK